MWWCRCRNGNFFGREGFFFHFQQYLPFASSPLLQNNAQGPGAAGRREMPHVFSNVAKMLLQAHHSFPCPKRWSPLLELESGHPTVGGSGAQQDSIRGSGLLTYLLYQMASWGIKNEGKVFLSWVLCKLLMFWGTVVMTYCEIPDLPGTHKI